ncbi:hypothetical protein E2542_SST28165 [Spatholobus suberectus]|nr:hypothetical protein E2542_SST28165 [Spatholobus suberectus]
MHIIGHHDVNSRRSHPCAVLHDAPVTAVCLHRKPPITVALPTDLRITLMTIAGWRRAAATKSRQRPPRPLHQPMREPPPSPCYRRRLRPNSPRCEDPRRRFRLNDTSAVLPMLSWCASVESPSRPSRDKSPLSPLLLCSAATRKPPGFLTISLVVKGLCVHTFSTPPSQSRKWAWATK